MRILLLPILVILFLSSPVFSQNINKIISAKKVEKVEKVLSSDAMEGRFALGTAINKAADYIAAEFKKAGLQPLDNGSYFQEFTMVKTSLKSLTGNLNGKALDPDRIAVIGQQAQLDVDQASGYEIVYIKAEDNLYQKVSGLIQQGRNCLVMVDGSQKRFGLLRRMQQTSFPSAGTLVFIQSNEQPAQFSIHCQQAVSEIKLKNVVGQLPGKSGKDEYVIFSGHYDHLGIGKPNDRQDSIYNGANDDAAGTTAVIMLARYFAKKKDNERSLVFAAFTAEELGGYGSQYFSRQFDPEKVMAMFNIEMIGTESKWGKNAAYITGYEKTDMGTILSKNLAGTAFTFHPDPYTEQNLFYRSDNATLARQGVPAHTISTSKMDSEKYYHTQEDEIGTLDMKNMAAIIRAIALSSRSIIDGSDTPSRVDASKLK